MLFLITSITGFSQNNNPKDSTVLIISSGFEPFLSDAFKIKENPKISDTSRVIPKLTYRFLEKIEN